MLLRRGTWTWAWRTQSVGYGKKQHGAIKEKPALSSMTRRSGHPRKQRGDAGRPDAARSMTASTLARPSTPAAIRHERSDDETAIDKGGGSSAFPFVFFST